MTETTAPKLTDEWQAAARALLTGTDEGLVPTDDGWSIDLGLATKTAQQILALLPGDYSRRATHFEEMADGSGQSVDYESESGVYACDAERAIFAFTEHWQAGLTGTVTIYGNAVAYQRGLAEAMEPYAEEVAAESSPQREAGSTSVTDEEPAAVPAAVQQIVERFGSTAPYAEHDGVFGMALACTEVRDDGAPILQVCRNGAGLHFLCGKDHSKELWQWIPGPQVMAHVPLATLLEADPSLGLLATMNERHSASRATKDRPWIPDDDRSLWWF